MERKKKPIYALSRSQRSRRLNVAIQPLVEQCNAQSTRAFSTFSVEQSGRETPDTQASTSAVIPTSRHSPSHDFETGRSSPETVEVPELASRVRTAPEVVCALGHEAPSQRDSDGNGSEAGCSHSISVTNSEQVAFHLRKWACEHNVTHTSLTSLLKILNQHACFSDLPSDARTLLRTPRLAQVDVVGGGSTYSYFGIAVCVKGLLAKVSDLSSQSKSISLLFYVDGLQLCKSSNSQLWPILAKTQDIPGSGVFLVACYHGYEKPGVLAEFLGPLVKELLELIAEGLVIDGTRFSINVQGFVCDAPARAQILGIKGHTAFYGCGKCTQKGKRILRRHVFLKTNAPLRTDDGFAQKTHPEHHKEDTPLSVLPIGLVSQCPLDYMHLVCIGVTKKVILLWMRGPQNCRLRRSLVDKISECLVRLADMKCEEFARKPRSLKHIDRWKATELRSFLLYFGPVVLKDILSTDQYLHFLLLHVAISLLASDVTCQEYNGYAKELLLCFVRSFSVFFKRDYISYNVHCLVHLADDVLNYGPLDSFSAFPAETFMHHLKKLVKHARKPLEQVVNRIKERETAGTLYKLKHCSKKIKFSKMHSNGILAAGSCGPQFQIARFPRFVLRTSAGDNACIVSDSAAVLVANFAHDGRGNKLLLGRKLTVVGDLYTKPCASSNLGICIVKESDGPLLSWNLLEMKTKCVLLPLGDSETEFALVPLLHTLFPPCLPI